MADYYVNPASGGTDSGTQANPWTDPNSADGVAGSGDTVYCQGTFNGTLNIAASTGVRWVGTNASWADDGTRFVIDGQSTRANGLTPAIDDMGIIKNFEIKGHTDDGVFVGSGISDGVLKNCYSHNNGGSGFKGLSTSIRWAFLGCWSANNTVDGFETWSQSVFIACAASGNGGNGWTCNATFYTLIGCLGYSNTTRGIFCSAAGPLLLGNVFDDNGTDGASGSTAGTFLFNRLTNNGDDGLDLSSASVFEDYNFAQGNTGTNIVVAGLSGENSTTTGTIGYVNAATGNYMLNSSATLRNQAVSLGDGVNSLYESAGLNPEEVSGGGSGRRSRIRLQGV